MTEETTTEGLLSRPFKLLNLEQKRAVVTAIYISWVKEDLENRDYDFLAELIHGYGGFEQLTDEHSTLIEQEYVGLLEATSPGIKLTDDSTVEQALRRIQGDSASFIISVIKALEKVEEPT